ncbi:hypothetical protein ACFSX9_10420 [Flavobacterium ardleyense]|uniref:Uncharacterized protein n=1 Tax=Flavobacterium ardleyense TaxID=2038737 RepID=A0ABW5Z8E6_9FLAO
MFFTKDNSKEVPEWLPQMQENQTRWFAFIEKMTEKAQELFDASLPELKEVFNDDPDVNKRAQGSMLAGINGQFEHMRKKAHGVYEEKINDFYYYNNNLSRFGSNYQDVLGNFREDCYQTKNAFESALQRYKDLLSKAIEPDWEVEYQKVLDAFDAVKNKFQCIQCSAFLPLEKIYFISTYITCSHCQTQNTFNPGTQISMLQSIGRSLAEQRTAHLLQLYSLEKGKERELYYKLHENRVHHTDDAATKKIKEDQNEIWDAERKAAVANAPALYEMYLRAMFDEWIKIVPDLAIQNEKFHDRMLADFRKNRF